MTDEDAKAGDDQQRIVGLNGFNPRAGRNHVPHMPTIVSIENARKCVMGGFRFSSSPGTRNLQIRRMLPVQVLENVNDTCLILYTIEAGVCIHELEVRFRRKKHTLFLPMSLQRVRSFLDCCSASLDCFLSLLRSKQSV